MGVCASVLLKVKPLVSASFLRHLGTCPHRVSSPLPAVNKQVYTHNMRERECVCVSVCLCESAYVNVECEWMISSTALDLSRSITRCQ